MAGDLADQLGKLKRLFADDGLALTDEAALEIGLWLLARVRNVLTPVPLDRLGTIDIIRDEVASSRAGTPLVNLYDWRRKPSGK